MGKQGERGIAWTEHTWNPIRGCSRVSEGCRNCYAERVAGRFSGPGQPYEGLARIVTIKPANLGISGTPLHTEARWTGKVRLIEEHLEDPLHWTKPRMIFVNSMSDLFHEALSEEDTLKVIDVMIRSLRKVDHVFQVLTKRPKRMQEILRKINPIHMDSRIWWGVSVEDQEMADERIPYLLDTPAAIRWISYEPALGPLQLHPHWLPLVFGRVEVEPGIDWIVVGGESGPGARPMKLQWALDIKEQCRSGGVAFFFKQGSETGDHARHKDYKNILCFPWQLQVREYPQYVKMATLKGEK
jgi:protein gp37